MGNWREARKVILDLCKSKVRRIINKIIMLFSHWCFIINALVLFMRGGELSDENTFVECERIKGCSEEGIH